jgi:hypothetical protein
LIFSSGLVFDQPFNSAYKFFLIDRLGEVRIGSLFYAPKLIHLAAFGRADDNRDVACFDSGFDFTTDIKPAGAG